MRVAVPRVTPPTRGCRLLSPPPVQDSMAPRALSQQVLVASRPLSPCPHSQAGCPESTPMLWGGVWAVSSPPCPPQEEGAQEGPHGPER